MNYCSGWFKNFRIKNKQILIIAHAKVVPASLGRIWHPSRQFLQQNKGMRGQRRGRKGREWRKENRRRQRTSIHTYIHVDTHTSVMYTLRKRRVRHWWSGELHTLHTEAFGTVAKQSLSRYENVGVARREVRKGDALRLLKLVSQQCKRRKWSQMNKVITERSGDIMSLQSCELQPSLWLSASIGDFITRPS